MLGLAERFNSLNENLRAIGAILGWFGWTPAITSTALALATGAWAWFERLPYAVIWTCGFTVLVMSICLIKEAAFYRLLKESGPNAEPSDNWRHVPHFYLSQAALLLAGREPFDTPQLPPGPAVPWFMALQGAVSSGEIERIPDPQDIHHMDGQTYRPNVGTKVSRDELRKFAEKRNKHPRFLED